jgi:hypothetical protein
VHRWLGAHLALVEYPHGSVDRTAASKPTWLPIGQIEPLLRHYEKGGAGRGIGRDARERRQSAAGFAKLVRRSVMVVR